MLISRPARGTREGPAGWQALFAAFALALWPGAGGAGRASAVAGPPAVVRLPSARPSGTRVNDTIWVRFYPAQGSDNRPAPAVVLVHPLAETEGSFTDRYMRRLARDLAGRGIGCALMTLPFHGRRGVADGQPYLRHFAGSNVAADVAALDQSASDVGTVAAWLATRPDVDARRVGAVGLSIGAIIVHLAMGRDERLSAGVALLGGGGLPDLYRHSLPIRLFGGFSPALLTPGAVRRLQAVDPAAYRPARPRRVLMVQAARDLYVPPASAEFLWAALGRPPIQWVDTNHFAPFLAETSVARTVSAFLTQAWNGGASPVPPVAAPTIKFGLVCGLDSVLSPALQWQFHSFATRRDHMSLLHGDVGLSGRGPFLSLAVTLNAFVDAGVAQRLGAKSPRPYLSLHVVF